MSAELQENTLTVVNPSDTDGPSAVRHSPSVKAKSYFFADTEQDHGAHSSSASQGRRHSIAIVEQDGGGAPADRPPTPTPIARRPPVVNTTPITSRWLTEQRINSQRKRNQSLKIVYAANLFLAAGLITVSQSKQTQLLHFMGYSLIISGITIAVLAGIVNLYNSSLESNYIKLQALRTRNQRPKLEDLLAVHKAKQGISALLAFSALSLLTLQALPLAHFYSSAVVPKTFSLPLIYLPFFAVALFSAVIYALLPRFQGVARGGDHLGLVARSAAIAGLFTAAIGVTVASVGATTAGMMLMALALFAMNVPKAQSPSRLANERSPQNTKANKIGFWSANIGVVGLFGSAAKIAASSHVSNAFWAAPMVFGCLTLVGMIGPYIYTAISERNGNRVEPIEMDRLNVGRPRTDGLVLIS